MELKKVIKVRFSCKKYSDRQVEDEKIQAILPAGAIRDCTVFGIGFVCSFLQDFQHGKDLLYR